MPISDDELLLGIELDPELTAMEQAGSTQAAPTIEQVAAQQPIPQQQEYFQQEPGPEQISATAGTTTGGITREAMEAVFPRDTKDEGLSSKVFDLMSLPGRVAAALLFKGDKENFLEAVGHIEAPEEAGFLRSMAENMLRDPATPVTLVPGVGLGARALSSGSRIAKMGKLALLGAGEGLVSGTIHQADIAAQGGDPSMSSLVAETALGAIIPTGLKGVGMGLKKMGPGARKIASMLSGTSEDALKMYGGGFGLGSKKLKALAGRQKEVGDKLLLALEDRSPLVRRKPGEISFDDFIKEENDIVNQAFMKMDPIPLKNTIAVIKDEINALPLEETQKEIRGALEKLLMDIGGKKKLSGTKETFTKTLNPKVFKNKQKALSDLINWNAPNAKTHDQAIRNIRRAMKEELESSAIKTGNPKYMEAMASMHQKIEARDNILDLIGKGAKKRGLKVEAFTSQIFNKNKTAQRELFKELEKAVGPEFLESAKIAKMAESLGMTLEDPSASLFPGKGLAQSFLNVGTAGLSGLGAAPVSGKLITPIGLAADVAGQAIGAEPTRKTLSQLSRSSLFRTPPEGNQ